MLVEPLREPDTELYTQHIPTNNIHILYTYCYVSILFKGFINKRINKKLSMYHCLKRVSRARIGAHLWYLAQGLRFCMDIQFCKRTQRNHHQDVYEPRRDQCLVCNIVFVCESAVLIAHSNAKALGTVHCDARLLNSIGSLVSSLDNRKYEDDISCDVSESPSLVCLS